MIKVYAMLIVIAMLGGVGFGAYKYYTDTQQRIQRVGKEELYKIFDEVPIEPDTRILAKAYGEKDSILFRIEEWSWDGIYGKTIVISSKQCSTLVTEEDIKTKFEIKGETTFKKVGQYYFLNYDFSI